MIEEQRQQETQETPGSLWNMFIGKMLEGDNKTSQAKKGETPAQSQVFRDILDIIDADGCADPFSPDTIRHTTHCIGREYAGCEVSVSH